MLRDSLSHSLTGSRFDGLGSKLQLGRFLFPVPPREVLDIIESNVNHEADQEHSARGLNRTENTGADRLAADCLDNRQHDMASIQNGNRKHVQQSEIDVHQDTKPDREAPALLAVKKAV